MPRGQDFGIKAEGHLAQKIGEGGSLSFTSWSGNILVHDEVLELCEGLEMFG